MQSRFLLPVVAALALASLPACRKESTPPAEKARPAATTDPGAPAAPAATAPAAKPEAPKPAITPAEVAPLLAQGAELPKDFETLLVIDAGQVKRTLKSSPIWKQGREAFGISESELPAAATPEDTPADASSPVAVGTEAGKLFETLTSGRITVATGPGTSVQSLELLRLIGLVQKATMRQTLIKMAGDLGLAGKDDPEDMNIGNPFSSILTEDFDKLVAGIDKLAPPVVYIALEAKGQQAQIEKMLGEWDGGLGENLPPFMKKEAAEIGGGKFSVISISAQEMVSKDDLKESVGEDLKPEQVDRLHAALVKKKLVVGFGLRDEHLVLFLAPELGALKFVASPAESMAARDEFSFLAECKDKKPFLISMASKEVNESLRGGMDNGYLADVLKDTLGKITALGDLSDVMALCAKTADSLRDLSKGKDTGFCAAGWYEDGVRIEALGGADSPQLDGTKPLAFADALGSEDTVLMIDSRSDAAYQAKALDMLEDVAEIGYELGQRYAASEAGKDKPMAEPFKMFREKMLPHISTLWKVQRAQIQAGLDQECALVMDVGAAMPKFPGLPEALADKGRIPRMALVYPVADRAKLGDGWQAMQPALKGLLEAIPLPEGKKVNLPDAFTSEKNGLKTYFYGFSGVTTDDFMPSVSLSDKLFFASSSKNLSEALAAKLAEAKPGRDAPRGLVMQVKFGPALKAGLDWLDLVKTNAVAVFPDEAKRLQFLDGEPTARKFLDLAGSLDSLSLRRAPEGTRWRTSLHIRSKAK